MKYMISKLQLTSLLAAFAVVALMAATAQATVHPISGNARFQIGDGLPIPITFVGPPNGGVPIVAGAVISQAAGPDPKAMVMEKKTFETLKRPFNLPVWGSNHAVYQVNTSIGIEIPLVDETLSAGGRTGAATVSYCPGQTVTATGNPGCASGLAAPGSLKGIMIYSSTGNQFGGAMGGRLFGTANVALNILGATSMQFAGGVIMHMALASPVSTGTGGIGNAFGGVGASSGKITTPGVFSITASPGGAIGSATPTSMGDPGLTNAASSGGGPWTTGMLVVTQPLALGTAEKFTLTGSDNRLSGVGTISMVAGGVSNRTTSGPNANRGWMNMTIGEPLGALPSMSGPGIAALVGLMSLAGGYAMRQRNRK
jgi:hypothetical protein